MESPLERFVSFDVYSDTIHPSDLTKIIGLAPDETWIKGSPRRPQRPTALAITHKWMVKEGGSAQTSFDFLLERLFARLQPRSDALHSLLHQGSATGHLALWWNDGEEIEASYPNQTPPGYIRIKARITSEHIAWLAALPAEITFD